MMCVVVVVAIVECGDGGGIVVGESHVFFFL